VSHLVNSDVLRVSSERMEKKEGQKFAASRQSLALGPGTQGVLNGTTPIRFAIQARCSRTLVRAARGMRCACFVRYVLRWLRLWLRIGLATSPLCAAGQEGTKAGRERILHRCRGGHWRPARALRAQGTPRDRRRRCWRWRWRWHRQACKSDDDGAHVKGRQAQVCARVAAGARV
jgi:hypothetical protein